MRSISMVLWLSAALGFYTFKTPVGLFLIIVASAVAIGICVGTACSVFRKAVAVACMAGVVLGGFCAFRLEVALFSGASQASAHSLIFVTHNEKTAATLYQDLAGLGHAYDVKISKNAAALFTALVTGRKTYVPLALQDIVRRSGISHLFALSGFHLQVILFFITRIQRLLPRKVFCLSCCTLVWVYCLWLGFIPSLWRAAFMYTMSAAALVCIGVSNFTVVWSLTGFCMMLIFPHALTMPGFVLSMLALYGVVHGSVLYAKVFESYAFKLVEIFSLKRVHKIVKNIIRSVCAACAMGVGAVFFTMWYSMMTFGLIYPIGIVASLFLTPVVVLFMSTGIGLLCVQFVQAAFLSFFGSFFGSLSGRLGVIDILCNALGVFMDALAYGMNALLARMAQIHSISSWTGLVFFYGILIAICLPYCLNTAFGKSIVRFVFVPKPCTVKKT